MKTKMYSNQPRKPMMYGGDSRTKMMYGGNSRMKRKEGSTDNGEKMSDMRAAEMTASVTGAKKPTEADLQRQRREELKRNNTLPELRKIAAGSDRDAAIAKSILREMGDKGAMPPGDQQPTE